MDSMEDRFAAEGKHEEFTEAVEAFRDQSIDDQELYDRLTNLGASPEEADEFINVEIASGGD